ncbi:MAG: hypothetical protein Q8O64_18840 [Sideroxyarcus sp.]|nr:hypothetical protein [Sideroxyarcus sp.]
MPASAFPPLPRLNLSICLCTALCFPLPALAENETPTLFESGIAATDATQGFVSRRFVALVSSIDRFFGGERHFQESNNSVLQLDWNELMEPGGARQGRLSGRAKLQLPSTEQRFHLLLESDPVQNTTSVTPANQPQAAGLATAAEKYAAALRYEKLDEQTWFYSSDVGIRVQAPLQPFVRGRVSHVIPLQAWLMKNTGSLFWFSQIGPGSSAQIDFDRSLTTQTLFRTSSNATWLHLPQRLDLRQDFTLFHTLDERRALQYQASVISTSQPYARVDDCILSALYRRQLHRKWLFFEVNPQLHFPHDEQFRFTPQLWLRLQVLFSNE